MPSGFVNPITIKEAINNIVDRSYLLPAIQRKFVWSSEQIEILFDSIMRGYPINSFMFWEVKDSKIKSEFKFYQFLTEFRQFFKEDNPDMDTKGYKDFMAIIDGQQRLTSLYIGLKGTYAYKMPRKWWYNNEENLPTRMLYLYLGEPLSDENERQMIYNFQFLTKQEYERKSTDDPLWFKVNDILSYGTADELDNLLDEKEWLSRPFTKQTLRKLRKVIFDEKLINYYLETTQEIDIVLDIFIRTNSGGEPLSFSDLLMSITTAHWRADARKEIPDVVNKVFEIGNPGFMISKDFVLKTCLVLFNDNIKFQVKNFDRSNVVIFEEHWDRIRKSIIEAFRLLANLGFNNHSLRAKNAAIPVIYYIFHRGIENEINNPIRHQSDKTLIRKWLCLSLLKGVFSSQSDNVLNNIRKVIKSELETAGGIATFPLDRIKAEFKGNPSKSLSFDDEYIEGLLSTQKDAGDAFTILSLLYSHLNFTQQVFHKDHLHPAAYFNSIKREDFQSEGDFNYYKDPSNWNSIVNLQLLNGSMNQSKLDTPLHDWVVNNRVDRINQLIPDVSLQPDDLRVFLSERKKMLIEQLKRMV
ncbi:DUF262 domain-containing protein [Mucilaginibacter sp. SMC90]|uniref:DUF262 domain-containing protein n=1 Tax=Mucilaginibacter sp. SMC90 TaxID=2929803 RepID=UPI001FB38AF9|nr:DUF262 domain-containing protein [Mucilaginibacter sp. SMC90]UOE49147.1 DUF262 domain-containing protein [Mucilaginibacter sp. SMC90]